MTKGWRPGKRAAIIGAGPGGASAALAMLQQGYDVRLYERNADPKPLGGGVLLSVPVLAILRQYDIDITNFGSFTKTQFRNNRGKVRVRLPFNENVEKAMGIKGWHYGVLRSNAFGKMLNALPDGVLISDHKLDKYEEQNGEIQISFENGAKVTADILIGADGIRSVVSRQTFGDPGIFHVGLRAWLGWCDDPGGIEKELAIIHHSRNVQASYFPMLHDGKPGFEWWIVERSAEGSAVPVDVEGHIRHLLADFPSPMSRFPDHTDFETQLFRWEIYNRPTLKTWTKGRVACVGDAVHPVSPYAAYGMGMAIEDGYFLARSLGGRDLTDLAGVTEAFRRYEAERVDYVNHHVEFARELGKRFHHASAPMAWLRDFIFDHTGFLQRQVEKDYLASAEKMSLQLMELHRNPRATAVNQ